MKVIWNNWSENLLRQTADYIQVEFGKEAKVKFLQDIYHTTTLLQANPNLGKVEPLLANAPVLYRSIVVSRLNKIIYWINEDTIEIVDFWDTRREPKKQAKQIN